MPAHNAEKTIAKSIESVLCQTFCLWELIVVDDASTDGTNAIASRFADADNRIRIVTSTANLGTAGARNTAIAKATGKYLAFLDSDDIWHKDKLERQIEFMTKTSAPLSYTATAYISADGTPSKYVLPTADKLTYKKLLRKNIMSCSSVVVERDIVTGFPQGNMHEDYVMWLELVKKTGHASGLNKPLLTYRIGENTKSSNRIKSAKMTWNAYRYVGYGRIRSMFFVFRYAFHSIAKRRKIKRGWRRFSLAGGNK